MINGGQGQGQGQGYENGENMYAFFLVGNKYFPMKILGEYWRYLFTFWLHLATLQLHLATCWLHLVTFGYILMYIGNIGWYMATWVFWMGFLEVNDNFFYSSRDMVLYSFQRKLRRFSSICRYLFFWKPTLGE